MAARKVRRTVLNRNLLGNFSQMKCIPYGSRDLSSRLVAAKATLS